MTESRSWHELDHEGRQRCRFDFISEVVATNDETQTLTLKLSPDPRRYSVSTIRGERHYLDRFLKVLIPESVVGEMMLKHLNGLPISYAPPTIESSSEYARSRKVALKTELSGKLYSPPTEKATTQKELATGSEDSFISFLSIDIVGSTALRQRHGEKFDRAYSIFLRELLTNVGQFHGAILNVTGDGFIAYIDMPGFTTQCDNTVDLGLTLLKVLAEGVNPSLKEVGLPTLEIRVGADAGKATKRLISVETTGFRSYDVGSTALNRAVKIEQAAQSGQFLIGQALYELLHVKWLERSQQVPFNGSKIGVPEYSVYAIS